MDAADLFAALPEGDNVMATVEDVVVEVSGPYWCSLTTRGSATNPTRLVQLTHDLAELLLAETTNNDATEVMMQARYNRDYDTFTVTAAITNWAS